MLEDTGGSGGPERPFPRGLLRGPDPPLGFLAANPSVGGSEALGSRAW